MAKHVDTCLLGCSTAGGGDICHYVASPFSIHGRKEDAGPLPWRDMGLLAILGTMAISAALADLSECWLCLVYRTVTSAKHGGILSTGNRRTASFSTAVRSLVMRDPRVRRVIFDAGTVARLQTRRR